VRSCDVRRCFESEGLSSNASDSRLRHDDLLLNWSSFWSTDSTDVCLVSGPALIASSSTTLALELSWLEDLNIDSCVDVDEVLLSVESSLCNNKFLCKLFRLESIVFVFVCCLARPDLHNLSSPVLCEGDVCLLSVGQSMARRDFEW